MKKTYIVPSIETASYMTGVLMEGSVPVDGGTTLSGDQGGWARRQIWTDEEE